MTMECVRLDMKQHKLYLSTEKIPKVESDTDVIVRIAYTGVCGTDLHLMQGLFEATEGVILGHESVGIIASISPKCTQLKIGDKVAINPNLTCGSCTRCKIEMYNFCEEGGMKHALGIMENGGWAQYCKAHVSLVHKIPDTLTLEQAVLCEPLSCIIHGIDRLGPIRMGSNILILGAGIIGILWSVVLHVSGHRNVVIAEDRPSRIKVLEDLELGYTCVGMKKVPEYYMKEGKYIDFCIGCRGRSETIQAAVPYLDNGAKILIFGVMPPNETLDISVHDIFKKELTIMGAKINTTGTFEKALAYLTSMGDRYLQIEKLGMQIFPLKDYQTAMEAFNAGIFTKIIFKPGV